MKVFKGTSDPPTRGFLPSIFYNIWTLIRYNETYFFLANITDLLTTFHLPFFLSNTLNFGNYIQKFSSE